MRSYTVTEPTLGAPSYTRALVGAMLGQEAAGIAQIAKETGLTRRTVYRIKDDRASAEAASGSMGL
jgi:DNA-binding phage protein